MNKASQAIIRWHLSNFEGADQHGETLLDEISRGFVAGHDGMRKLFYSLLAMAHEKAKGTSNEDAIERLFELHFKLAALEDTENRIRDIEELLAVADTKPNGPISARIRKNKINELVGKLGLDEGPQ
jgi:hypothetical protein